MNTRTLLAAAAFAALAAGCRAESEPALDTTGSSHGTGAADGSGASNTGTGGAGGHGAEGSGAGGAAPESCDPYAPRDPAPALTIGPSQFEDTILALMGAAKSSIDVMMYQF